MSRMARDSASGNVTSTDMVQSGSDNRVRVAHFHSLMLSNWHGSARLLTWSVQQWIEVLHDTMCSGTCSKGGDAYQRVVMVWLLWSLQQYKMVHETGSKDQTWSSMQCSPSRLRFI